MKAHENMDFNREGSPYEKLGIGNQVMVIKDGTNKLKNYNRYEKDKHYPSEEVATDVIKKCSKKLKKARKLLREEEKLLLNPNLSDGDLRVLKLKIKNLKTKIAKRHLAYTKSMFIPFKG